MSVSYHVYTNRKCEFCLWQREWYFQGDRPDWTFLGVLDQEEAQRAIETFAKYDELRNESKPRIRVKAITRRVP